MGAQLVVRGFTAAADGFMASTQRTVVACPSTAPEKIWLTLTPTKGNFLPKGKYLASVVRYVELSLQNGFADVSVSETVFPGGTTPARS